MGLFTTSPKQRLLRRHNTECLAFHQTNPTTLQPYKELWFSSPRSFTLLFPIRLEMWTWTGIISAPCVPGMWRLLNFFFFLFGCFFWFFLNRRWKICQHWRKRLTRRTDVILLGWLMGVKTHQSNRWGRKNCSTDVSCPGFFICRVFNRLSIHHVNNAVK